ncbi:MAG: hypothetical protein ACI85E_002056, partial [Marinomonas primoryensis]
MLTITLNTVHSKRIYVALLVIYTLHSIINSIILRNEIINNDQKVCVSLLACACSIYG